MSSDVALLTVGTQVFWDGQPTTVIRRKNGFVTLMDLRGNELPAVPAIAVAQALQTDDDPPAPTPLLPGLENRLSDNQREHLAADRDLFSLLDHGLDCHDLESGRKPPKNLDPAQTPLDERIALLARRIARERHIQVASARRWIKERISRRPGGTAKLVNANYHKLRKGRYDPRLPVLLEAHLESIARGSTRPNSSIYIDFMASILDDQPDVIVTGFSFRTFERALGEICTRRPEFSRRAPSRRSALDRNKATHARRVATRPGELWLVDTTKLNVMLWDPHARAKNDTFRPELTMIIDFATRLICGYCITTTTTGFAIGLAIASALVAMTDPDIYVEVDGMTYPRPFVGLPKALGQYPLFPESLGSDNGRNYLSIQQVARMERLRSDFEPGRSFSPDDKAQMERALGSVKTMLESLTTGYTAGSVDERGEDPAAEAVVTYQEFFRRLDEWINIFNFRVHRGLTLPGDPNRDLSPYEMWSILVEDAGVAEVPRWKNEWIYFLPFWSATISTDGVSFGDLMYNAPILADIKQTVPTLDGSHQFYRNPADMRRIYCFDKDGAAFEIPWAGLTEDTPVFGDYLIGRVSTATRQLHLSTREYQDVMIEFARETKRIDKESKHKRSVARPLAEELLDFNLSRIRALDEGHFERAVESGPRRPGALTSVPDEREVDSDDDLDDAIKRFA